MGSKVTTILPQLNKKSKTLNIGMWGFHPEAIDWNIALCTQIQFWESVSEVRFQKKKYFRA